MSRVLVTRCICHGKSFKEIKSFAFENEIKDVKELQILKYCSNSCRMCVPYVEMVLETGETEFAPGAYYGRKTIE